MPLDEARASRLLESGLALSSELALDILLQRTVELAADLTDARYAALGIVQGRRIVDFLTTGISTEERKAIGDLPRGRGLLGALIETGRPLRLHDMADDPRSVGFPPRHPAMRSFLGAPVRAGGITYGNLYLTEKRGGDFTAADEEAVVLLASQAGVAIANASLYREARLRERWLEVIRDIGYQILADADTRETLALLARHTRELAGAEIAMVLTPAVGGEHLEIEVAEGSHAEAVAGMRVPIEGSMSGRVLREARPCHVVSPATTPGLYAPMVEAAYMGPTLFLPLGSGGAAVGVLVVSRDAGSADFGEDEVLLLESFGAQAALALEYGRVQRELRRLALVEDRERIARELHDGVVQALFAVGLGIQGAAGMLDDSRAAARLEQAVAEIDGVIGDLRRYIFGLRPAVLANGGLATALEELCAEAEGATGVTTVLEVDVTAEAWLADRQSDVVQLVREALSNVGRHAHAATCRVSLRRDGTSAVVEVDDDGAGFDVGTLTAGLGLGNLRARATRLGGDITLESERGAGTTVRIRIPARRGRDRRRKTASPAGR